MWWVIACVGLAAAGLMVLGVLAIRVFLAAQELARQVAAGTEALTRAADRLQQAARPMAERVGEISRH